MFIFLLGLVAVTVGLSTYPFLISVRRLHGKGKSKLWWFIAVFGVSWFGSGVGAMAGRDWWIYAMIFSVLLTVALMNTATRQHNRMLELRKNMFHG